MNLNFLDSMNLNSNPTWWLACGPTLAGDFFLSFQSQMLRQVKFTKYLVSFSGAAFVLFVF